MLQHCRDGIDDVIDIARVERCDADASGADGIDAEFFLQARDLVGRESGVEGFCKFGL